MTPEDFPLIPLNLLEAIEKVFRPRPLRLDMRSREIWFEAGQRQVVDWLRAKYHEQNPDPSKET